MSIHLQLLLDFSKQDKDVNEFLLNYQSPVEERYLSQNEYGIFLDGEIEDLLNELGITFEQIKGETIFLKSEDLEAKVYCTRIFEHYHDETIEELVIDFNTIKNLS